MGHAKSTIPGMFQKIKESLAPDYKKASAGQGAFMMRFWNPPFLLFFVFLFVFKLLPSYLFGVLSVNYSCLVFTHGNLFKYNLVIS